MSWSGMSPIAETCQKGINRIQIFSADSNLNQFNEP